MNTMEALHSVAIYARVSTTSQETENQLAELRTFCERQGWKIYKEYIDHKSGATASREAFTTLFEDAHKKRFDLVLFWALDRFSREGVRETLQHLERLDNYGVAYKSYTEQYIDSAGMFRDAIIAIIATLAKQERVRLSERTRAGLDRAKSQGKKLGRPTLSDVKIQEIKTLKAQGLSIRKIAKQTGVSVGSVAKV